MIDNGKTEKYSLMERQQNLCSASSALLELGQEDLIK
jgi:hypothetical protein